MISLDKQYTSVIPMLTLGQGSWRQSHAEYISGMYCAHLNDLFPIKMEHAKIVLHLSIKSSIKITEAVTT